MEEQREQQSHKIYLHGHTYGDSFPDYGIKLLDLWRILMPQWKVIASITTLSVLGAVAYFFLVTPVYEVEAVVSPPESKHVEALNVPGISEISSAEFFAKFTLNLKSASQLQQFFTENPQFSALQQQFTDQTPQFLRDNLPKIKQGTKNETGLLILSLQGYDSKLIADWLNGFILHIEKKTIDNFVAGVEASLANRKQKIETQLQLQLDYSRKHRLDRIALLEEQIGIARTLKIVEGKIAEDTSVAGQSIGVTVITEQEPLYLRGVKKLTAEKEALIKRENDEPFIYGFRDKQEELAELTAGLKQLLAARMMAHAVTIDQLAIETRNPVKPRRMLVLTLGLVIGVMTGILAAFIINLVQEQKVKSQE